MPNHVYCTISTTKKHTLETFYKWSKKLNGGMANLIIPRPTEQDENWYDWNRHNWGTKWGFYDQDFDESSNGATLDFVTAWNEPSQKLLDKIALHLPDMNFSYEEETGWGGEMQYENAEKVYHETFTEPPFSAEGWDDEENRYERLDVEYRRRGITHKIGWYHEGCLDLSVPDLPTDSEKIVRVEEW